MEVEISSPVINNETDRYLLTSIVISFICILYTNRNSL